MGSLFDLIASIGKPTLALHTQHVETCPWQSTADIQAAQQVSVRTPPLPHAAGHTEAFSDMPRNAWTITIGGKPICRMVGAPCTRAEALADARWRWPDAEILKN